MSDDKRRARTHKDDDNRANVGAGYRTPRSGVPVVIDHETTGQCDTPEEVTRMRARRLTPERISRLEVKHDELAKEVAATRTLVAVVDTKTDGQTRLIQAIQTSVDRIANRDDIKYQSNLTINEATKLDTLDAGKAKRWVKSKIAVLAAGALLGIEHGADIVHWIAGKL